MVHLLDASGNPIRHGRPSPRTGSTGVGIQKFGTQQLKMLDPQLPALGVIEKDVGARSRIFGLFPSFGTQPVYGSTPSTPFSQRYQQLRPATIRTEEQLETSPHAIPLLPDFGDFQFPDLFGGGNGKEKCHLDDNKPFCAITQAIGGEVCECPDWFTGKVTDPTAGGRGCECEACKNGTGQCDASAPECDAWDLACIAGTHTTNIITKPAGDWWGKYGNYVYLILGVIGLGILLWLLRPLFGFAKSVTEVSKSAVTKVNGLK